MMSPARERTGARVAAEAGEGTPMPPDPETPPRESPRRPVQAPARRRRPILEPSTSAPCLSKESGSSTSPR